jgi:arsenite oxidase large subunit
MNGERRLRLVGKYMDAPGSAQPDCIIAARLANHLERILRDEGRGEYANQFKGFDWKAEEDAFMDGYHSGNPRVTCKPPLPDQQRAGKPELAELVP